MHRKWIVIIGSGVLVAGLGVAGASFAKSDVNKGGDYRGVVSGTGSTLRFHVLQKAVLKTKRVHPGEVMAGIVPHEGIPTGFIHQNT